MTITLTESMRAIFYAPFYAGFSLGAYEQEGLDVKLDRPDDPGGAAKAVLAGTADVVWGGPMNIMQNHNADPECGITGFCDVVTRDPFFLVGRTPKPDFRFSDLRGVTLGTVSEVPTPWMCLQDDIRRANIDPASLDRIGDRTMADNCAALRAGTLDVVQCFQPFVEQLVRDGAHVWYAAANRGPTTYTCFYALRQTIARDPQTMHKLTRALWRVERWIASHDRAAFAEQVAPFFPDLSHDLLSAAIGRYLDVGLWATSPVLPVVGFVRLKSCLLSGGFIQRDIPFDHVMDNSIARAVMAEGEPPDL